MDKADITAALVEQLIAAQFPRWAHLPVASVDPGGWDNSTFRLGKDLSVRLPNGDDYTPQVEKEHRWLPILGRSLPLRVPEPLAKGLPGCGFPRPWSIYRWIEGDTASSGRVDDIVRFATDLAGFLAALQAVDPQDGPPTGAHNFFRGGPISTYDEHTRTSIEVLAGEIDATAATEVWDAAMTRSWDGAPVWVHGDVAPTNLLVADGRLRAVIDFGCCAVGDPACDLVMAWTYFVGRSRDTFRRGLVLDDATWARGRGWALWKALITLVDTPTEAAGPVAAAHRFGWRGDARWVIGEVIADHARTDG